MCPLHTQPSACALPCLGAEAQHTKTPKFQLWRNVSTGTMASMLEMYAMPPCMLDIALHNARRPGVEASRAISACMRIGEALPLLVNLPCGLLGR